jgi:hypothetical protein
MALQREEHGSLKLFLISRIVAKQTNKILDIEVVARHPQDKAGIITSF